MKDDVLLEVTGQVDSAAQLRQVLERRADTFERAMEALGPPSAPYRISVEFTPDLHQRGLSLVEVCRAVVTALANIAPPASFTGVDGAAVRGSGESSMTLRIRLLDDQPNQPAGMLLLDERLPASGHGRLQTGLSGDLMARPDAEYAVWVDAPKTDDHGVDIILSGLDLAKAIAVMLPAEPGAPSNLVQLSVRMADNEQPDSIRVRVWRLGFMKVPSRARFA